MKLKNGVLKNIAFNNLKTLFSEKNKIIHFSDFLRYKILQILEKKEEKFIKQDDFLEIKESIQERITWNTIKTEYLENNTNTSFDQIIRIFKSPENFKYLYEKNTNLRIALRSNNIQNIELVLSICDKSEDFLDLCLDIMILNFIEYTKTGAFSLCINLCKNHNDIKSIGLDYYIVYFLKSQPNKFKILYELLGIDSLEYLFSIFHDPKFIFFLENNFDLSKLQTYKNIRKLFEKNTYNTFKTLGLPIDKTLFNIKSKYSNFLKQLINKMIQNPDTEYADLLNNIVEELFLSLTAGLKQIDNTTRISNGKAINNFQKQYISENDEILINKLSINSEKHELSIYVRYGNTIDYPEIAEAIILFAKKYIKSGFSKYFSSIRIIPTKQEKATVSDFLFDEKTKFYDVFGEEFITSLHAFSSPIFLSHSTNSKPYKTPSIISNGMKKQRNDIKSNIELEEDYTTEAFNLHKKVTNFAEITNIEGILKEFLDNLLNLEKNLDAIRLSKFNIVKLLYLKIIKKLTK